MKMKRKKHNIPNRIHFTPVSYLRRFAVNPSLPRNKLIIHRLAKGESKSTPVKLEERCRKKKFYSPSKPKEVDDTIKILEIEYTKLLNKLSPNLTITDGEEVILLRLLIFEHIRTDAYTSEIDFVKTGNTFKEYEEFDRVHDDVYRLWRLAELLGLRYQEYTSFSDAIKNGFRYDSPLDTSWKIIRVSGDKNILHSFYTSCHPISLFCLEKSDLSMIILPLDPKKAIVCYRSDHLKQISSGMTREDIGYINRNTIIRAPGSIYFNEELRSSEDFDNLLGIQSKKGLSNQEKINLQVTQYNDELSFIKISS